MNLHRSTILLLALSACNVALAAGSGEFTRNGKTTKFTNVYAFKHPDHFFPKKTTTTVIFTTSPIDSARAAKEPDVSLAAEKQALENQGSYAALQISEDGSVETSFAGPGMGFGGPVTDKPIFTSRDDKHIAGAFHTSDRSEDVGSHHGFYDLTFDVELMSVTTK